MPEPTKFVSKDVTVATDKACTALEEANAVFSLVLRGAMHLIEEYAGEQWNNHTCALDRAWQQQQEAQAQYVKAVQDWTAR